MAQAGNVIADSRLRWAAFMCMLFGNFMAILDVQVVAALGDLEKRARNSRPAECTAQHKAEIAGADFARTRLQNIGTA